MNTPGGIIGVLMVIAVIELVILSVVATIFPVLYGWRSRWEWRKSLAGRTMMTQGVAMMFLIDLTALGVFHFVNQATMVITAVIFYGALIWVKMNLIRIVMMKRHPLTPIKDNDPATPNPDTEEATS